MISGRRLAQLRELIAEGREAEFYSWGEWKALRPDVLRLDNRECQRCKQRGRYRRASYTTSSTCGSGRTWR